MEPLNRQFRQVLNKITKKEERIPALVNKNCLFNSK